MEYTKYTKSQQQIYNRLYALSSEIENSFVRVSMAGVPHIIVDSKYSICYFKKRNIFKVWDNYATPDNHKIGEFKSSDEVIDFFDKLKQ